MSELQQKIAVFENQLLTKAKWSTSSWRLEATASLTMN